MQAHSAAMPPAAQLTPHPPPVPPLIALQRVYKQFDQGLQALCDVSLTVRPGEFVALLGPSGCGKSTVLRLVAGLDAASAGQVTAPALLAAGAAGGLGSGGGGRGSTTTAFVFQEPTLMPWATVFDNVWLPLRLQGVSRAAAAPAVRQVLARVGLADFEAAHPAQLSGGMKMRASIARALLTRPRVLLMDEPFAALDDITRQALNTDLLQWWQADGSPAGGMAALFVTHSVAEAVFLSQRVLVMAARPGRVVTELRVDAAYPREPGFRHSAVFHDACRALGEALAAAHGAHGAPSAQVALGQAVPTPPSAAPAHPA